jgi:hypothetical protein
MRPRRPICYECFVPRRQEAQLARAVRIDGNRERKIVTGLWRGNERADPRECHGNIRRPRYEGLRAAVPRQRDWTAHAARIRHAKAQRCCRTDDVLRLDAPLREVWRREVAGEFQARAVNDNLKDASGPRLRNHFCIDP